MELGPVVERLTARAFTAPTDALEADGTLTHTSPAIHPLAGSGGEGRVRGAAGLGECV
jgi:hypothetical protein